MATGGHVITTPGDLSTLRALIAAASGPITRAEKAFGDELEIEFGDAPAEVRGQKRPWLVGTQASPWALLDSAGAMVAEKQAPEDFERVLTVLRERIVESVDLLDDGLDLMVRLDDGHVLLVQAKADLDALESPFPEPPYWEIVTPACTVVAAGPGAGWVEYPADLGEDFAPLPGYWSLVDPRFKAVIRANRELEWRMAEVSAAFAEWARGLSVVSASIALISLAVLGLDLTASSFPAVELLAGLVGAMAAGIAAVGIREGKRWAQLRAVYREADHIKDRPASSSDA